MHSKQEIEETVEVKQSSISTPLDESNDDGSVTGTTVVKTDKVYLSRVKQQIERDSDES